MKKKEILTVILIGVFAGFLNGLLGAGGGIIIVPMLTRFMNIDRSSAHANAVFIILVMCVVSTFMYIRASIFDYREVIPYLPGGIIGAIVGSYLLSKIDGRLLRQTFGVFSIWSAFRLMTK